MWSVLDAVVNFFVGLKSLLFGGKGKDDSEDAASKAVAQSNDAGKLSADVSRQTESQNQSDTQNVDTQKSMDLADVHNANSMRERQNAVARIVGSPNEDTKANG